MIIKYSRRSQRWLLRHKINQDRLTTAITTLCSREGKTRIKVLKIHIMPRANDSNYDYWLNILNVAVESRATDPRYVKLRRICRNLLHELRHFIQFRIKNRPFQLSYSYRDMTLMNSRYWNDPDEIDARKYEKKKLNYLYKKLIKP